MTIKHLRQQLDYIAKEYGDGIQVGFSVNNSEPYWKYAPPLSKCSKATHVTLIAETTSKRVSRMVILE